MPVINFHLSIKIARNLGVRGAKGATHSQVPESPPSHWEGGQGGWANYIFFLAILFAAIAEHNMLYSRHA